MTTISARQGFVLKGWHVLAGFIVFFGVDIVVNTVFMMSAYQTFPGETSMTPYEDGIAYNATLAQRRAQAALGWRLAAGVDSGGVIHVAVSDRGGRPLNGLVVAAHLERPATEAGQRDLTLQAMGGGNFTGRAGPLPGAWDLRISARDGLGHVASAERRLTPS